MKITDLLALAVSILVIVSVWKVFVKAGQPGWASLIPFFNLYVLIKIAGKPGWWLLLMLIPLINLVFFLLVTLGLAERFGKGAGFGVGLFLLPFIFWPILAFGDDLATPKAV
ncbi:MAG: signal peptidase I [Elusimicrobia bacterium]|nr:signal peptidase I [Elusimicrobiota bacterium]